MKIPVSLFFILALSVPNISLAQGINCEKASTETEKEICDSPGLKEDELEMEKIYFALRKKLGPAGRAKLLAAQRSWLKERAEYSDSNILNDFIRDQLQFLSETPDGMVPFTETKITNQGKGKSKTKGYMFPVEKTALQKSFNRTLEKVLNKPRGSTDGKFEEELDATRVKRNDSYILSIRVYMEGFYGGVHPLHFAGHVNINKKTGQPVKISSLFDEKARQELAKACVTQLVAGRASYARFDSPEEASAQFEKDFPGAVRKNVGNAVRWKFEEFSTSITFDEYIVAAYVAGEQSCEFENDFLAGLSKQPKFFGAQ